MESPMQSPNSANDPWLYQHTMESATHAVVFETKNQFVDHNIKVEINVTAGVVTPIFENTNLLTYFTTDNANSTSSDVTITPKASALAGFIHTTPENALISGTSTFYKIKTAEVQPTNSNTNATITLLTTDDENITGTNISHIISSVSSGTTNEPSAADSYFLAFQGTGSSVINTAGWITPGVQTGASVTRYFQVREAAANINKKSGVITPSVEVTTSNVVLNNNEASGISIEVTGGGSASLTAALNITQSGYVPQKTNYKEQKLTINATTTSTTRYITGLIINSGKTLSSITNAGTININNTGIISITSNSTTQGTVTVNAKINTDDENTATAEIITEGKLHVATLKFSGGGLNNKAAIINCSNITTTSTDNGIKIETTGKAGRTAVTYNATTSGWISVTAGNTVSNQVNQTSWAGTTYYITGITVPKNIPFSITSTANAAYNDTSHILINNGAYRKVVVTNNGAVYARQTSAAGGIVYVRDPENNSNDIQVVSNGHLITTSINTSTTTWSKNNDVYTVTRGIASWGAGWISSNGSLPAALFTNNVSNSSNYVDISETPAAPILTSGGYLYITEGYTDNLKISLSKLVPDSITSAHGFAPAEYILTGYGAFNAAGTEIEGTMQIYAGAFTVIT